MKRIVTTIALATMIATAAIAQQPRRMGPNGGPGGPPPPRELENFLGLTADQKTQIDALHQSMRSTLDPLFEQRRAAEDQLHALVESANPDPTAVGKQFLAVHAIDEQLKAAHDANEQKVAALLTADQRVKFEAFNAARHMGPPPR
jgi:Spy/CpxP family protein refolding chaperone